MISLRSKEHRIIGTKKFEEYTVNGIDSLPSINSAFASTTYATGGIEWLSESEQSQIACTDGTTIGFWELSTSHEGEIFLRLPIPHSGGIAFPEGRWKILRLTEEELWVEINSNDNDYVIHFREV